MCGNINAEGQYHLEIGCDPYIVVTGFCQRACPYIGKMSPDKTKVVTLSQEPLLCPRLMAMAKASL